MVAVNWSAKPEMKAVTSRQVCLILPEGPHVSPLPNKPTTKPATRYDDVNRATPSLMDPRDPQRNLPAHRSPYAPKFPVCLSQWHSIMNEVNCVKEHFFLKEQGRYVKKLQTFYDAAHHLEYSFLDPASLPSLCIRCDELKLNNDGTYEETPELCFFDPNVMVYPRIFENERQRGGRG